MNHSRKLETKRIQDHAKADLARRGFLKKLGLLGATGAVAAIGANKVLGVPAWGGEAFIDAWAGLFQDHYVRMTEHEIQDALVRIERKAKRKYGVSIRCEDTKPIPGTYFGFALNLSKCRGYRDCVAGCVLENNLDRQGQMQYIRVLELDQGEHDLVHANHYYESATVPVEGKWYLPVQCQQCEDPPCVKACPIGATWLDDDGIVVIDYDWCIGCRMCMAACPYWARHFNWTEPEIPPGEWNPYTNYLGNRPRMQGVVEKCHFCSQRTRKGRLPACVEACPTGARIFGNLLDPASEIRYVLEHKRVFRLKEALGTEPKFWYFTDEPRARS
jgi:molybdopterin-containing oxidoreductase family iron-sulfur binding subunit